MIKVILNKKNININIICNININMIKYLLLIFINFYYFSVIYYCWFDKFMNILLFVIIILKNQIVKNI